jgi:hypothetical protein
MLLGRRSKCPLLSSRHRSLSAPCPLDVIKSTHHFVGNADRDGAGPCCGGSSRVDRSGGRRPWPMRRPMTPASRKGVLLGQGPPAEQRARQGGPSALMRHALEERCLPAERRHAATCPKVGTRSQRRAAGALQGSGGEAIDHSGNARTVKCESVNHANSALSASTETRRSAYGTYQCKSNRLKPASLMTLIQVCGV